MSPAEGHRLYRSRTDRIISGVCGGIAAYFDVDATLIRLIAVALLIIGNVATLIAYIIMSIVVPEEPTGFATPSAPTVPPVPPTPPIPPGAPGASSPAAAPGAGWPQVPAAPHPEATVPVSSAAGGPMPGEPRPRRGGVVVGIVLIAIGALALLAGVLPGVAFWQMWPLIFVAIGISEAVTPGTEGWSVARLFSGLSTIVFGFVLLANTTGVVSWSVWWRYLLPLFPVWIVGMGIGLLGWGLKNDWIRALGSVVVIAWLVLGAFVLPAQGGQSVSWGRAFWRTGGGDFSLSEPVGTVSRATFSLDVGAGDVKVDAGEDLVSIEGESPFGEPRLTVERSGTSAAVTAELGGSEDGFVIPGFTGAAVDAALASDVSWDADITTGASVLDADLSDLELSSLSVNTGVSASEIRLGTPVGRGDGAGSVLVKSGVGAVTVLVPRDVAARVEVSGGLAGVDVDRDFENLGGRRFQTRGYDEATQRWLIEVRQGVGSVSVRTY